MNSTNRSDRVLAVIVAYNPEIELLTRNITSIAAQVEMVLIVNNSIEHLPDCFSDTVVVIENGVNLGIAAALNSGIDFVQSCGGFEYLLFMDQDSMPDQHMVARLIESFATANDAAMAVPEIIYAGKVEDSNLYGDYRRVAFAITSGSLLAVKCIGKIGRFDESLFIDAVDFDYCFKLRIAGYQILQVRRARLYQQLGSLKTQCVFGIKFYPTYHNYLRRYYMVRNNLFVGKKYYFFSRLFIYKRIARMLCELLLVALFEDDKKRKIQYAGKGLYDFLRAKMGRLSG